MSICTACGKDFEPSRYSSGKFCGQSCYQGHPKRRVPLSERFWKYVEKGPNCWVWKASDDGGDGYGRIAVPTGSRASHRNIGAHRASWILHFGEIPRGLQVCHTCDNPRCVRPDHLFLGTNGDNQLDCFNKGRRPIPDNRGSRHGMSKLTETDIPAIRAAYIPNKKGNRAEIAARFGVSVSLINQIIWNQRWKEA